MGLDTVMSVLSIIAMWLIKEKKWYGFAVAIANQVLWVIFALSMHKLGLLIGVFFYTYIYIDGLRKWKREEVHSS